MSDKHSACGVSALLDLEKRKAVEMNKFALVYNHTKFLANNVAENWLALKRSL